MIESGVRMYYATLALAVKSISVMVASANSKKFATGSEKQNDISIMFC